jgi:hypothetical protein
MLSKKTYQEPEGPSPGITEGEEVFSVTGEAAFS